MNSLAQGFRDAVAEQFAAQPLTPPRTLTERDLTGLPRVVAAYIRQSGAVGRPRPRNIRVVCEAQMFRSPGASAMVARSVQVNLFDRPARLFFMKARMFGVPVRALHLYRDHQATFRVRAASLVDLVNLSGPQISAAETVTLLNDMCVFAPGTLADGRLAWGSVDDSSAQVTFSNGPHRVSATLLFDAQARLVDFWSDDRPDASSGRYEPARWRTPLAGYADLGGIWIASAGSAVYEKPGGPFEYGRFRFRSVRRDVAAD